MKIDIFVFKLITLRTFATFKLVPRYNFSGFLKYDFDVKLVLEIGGHEFGIIALFNYLIFTTAMQGSHTDISVLARYQWW